MVLFTPFDVKTMPADRGLNEHDKEAKGRRRLGLAFAGRGKGWVNARGGAFDKEGGAGMLNEEPGVGVGIGDEATTALVDITPADTP